MRCLVFVLLCACAGDITGTGKPPAQGGPDAASPDSAGSNTPDAGAMPDAPAFACRNKVNTVGSGNHHPGQDCQGACHNHGFTLGGTLFAAPNSTTPQIGATITVVDAAGKTVDMVSQQNGNFWTTQALTFPLSVTASECPNVSPMITKLTAADDGCNKGGCHVAGAVGVIHLP